jgi:hypothetical protein
MKMLVWTGPRLRLAAWVALAIATFGAVANIFKLVLNSTYAYSFPEFDTMLIDPVTGFMTGCLVVLMVAVVDRGLIRRSVWAAVLAMVAVPYLYLLMMNGVAAALTQRQSYFVAAGGLCTLLVEVVPASALVVLFGVEALRNYRLKNR